MTQRVQDADSSLGIYCLTRDKGWLQPLEALQRDIEGDLGQVANSAGGNQEQQRRFFMQAARLDPIEALRYEAGG